MPTVPKIKGIRTTDELCELIEDGLFLADIAERWGVTKNALTKWIAEDSDRSARARVAQDQSGEIFDREAERIIRNAPADQIEMARARELAQHMRWRSSMRSNFYRVKTHATVEATVSKAKPVTDEQAMEEIAQLSQQLGMKYVLAKVDDTEEEE